MCVQKCVREYRHSENESLFSTVGFDLTNYNLFSIFFFLVKKKVSASRK